MGGAREFITKPSECGSSPPHRQAPEKVDLLRATAAAASSGVIGAVLLFIFSAAFLVWDAIDLGFAISDLVRKRGSSASRVLREKADLLEEALTQTVDDYNTKIPD